MIDEWFERAVDRLCVSVPARVKPWLVRLSGTGIGWRILLYASSLGHVVAGAFGTIRSEDTIDSFLKETVESEAQGPGLEELRAALRRRLIRLSLRLERARLPVALFLLALSVLGVAAVGGHFMAACAAAMGFFFLTEGLETGYPPVCRGVRQRFLLALALKTAGCGALLLGFYGGYARQQVTTNVVLQSTMLGMLGIHALLFLALTAFNRRQPLLLRALSGVLGALWALCAAAAVALAASQLAAPPVQLAAALGAALGAVLLLLALELDTMMQLGAIRLRYGGLWKELFRLTGLALVLLYAWTGVF